mmetsp:Transcript_28758/g.72806  ORF Transcript_28758/g.72806 Transcript_28758/m.72806 type:complete len:217 (-) Transcript_28758:18-668(-)
MGSAGKILALHMPVRQALGVCHAQLAQVRLVRELCCRGDSDGRHEGEQARNEELELAVLWLQGIVDDGPDAHRQRCLNRKHDSQRGAHAQAHLQCPIPIHEEAPACQGSKHARPVRGNVQKLLNEAGILSCVQAHVAQGQRKQRSAHEVTKEVVHEGVDRVPLVQGAEVQHRGPCAQGYQGTQQQHHASRHVGHEHGHDSLGKVALTAGMVVRGLS